MSCPGLKDLRTEIKRLCLRNMNATGGKNSWERKDMVTIVLELYMSKNRESTKGYSR